MTGIEYNHQTGELSVPYRDETGAARVFNALVGGVEEPPPALPPAPPEPNPTFELYGHVEGRTKQTIKYRSGIYSPIDGITGCAGYADWEYLEINHREKTVTRTENLARFGSTLQNWVDGLTLLDGSRVFFSHNARGPLIHNPSTGEFSILSGPGQCRSGHLDKNGVLYFIQFSGRGPLRTIYRWDTLSKKWMPPIYYETDRTDEIYTAHPDWKKWNVSGAYDSQWGMTASGDGRYLYTSQFAAGRPLRIDTLNGTAEEWGEFNTCGQEIPKPLTKWVQLHWSSYWAKMSGGVQSSITKEAVIFPRRGNVVQVHGGEKGSRQITLPKEVLNDHHTRSFGCVEGPDGWIYSVLWHSEIIFAFHPVTDEFRTWDVSHLTKDMGMPTHKYAKGVFIPELNCIDFVPARAESVLRMSFPPSPMSPP